MRNLNDALRRVRIAEADRSDVASDLHEAERARLDILADELRGVFAEVPTDDEQFILKVATGTQPRLWIDMTSFVIIGRDRRTYRFVKDTRLGRTIIVESANVEDVADTITNYIAERIIEREKSVEGDWLIKRVKEDRSPSARRTSRRTTPAEPAYEPEARLPPVQRSPVLMPWVVAAGLGGILLALLILLAIAWFRV